MKNKPNNKQEGYYKDAANWYFDMFNMALSEKNVLIIIAVLASVVFLAMIYSMSNFFPLVPEKPYRIVLNDALGKIPKVEKLTTGSKKNVAIVRFLLKEYTKSREQFNLDKIERNFNMVEQFSAPDVLEEFQDHMSVSNPESPIIKYERHTKREIFISSSSIHTTDNWLNNNAIIKFESTERRGSEQKSDDWEAYITFNFDKISVNQETGELSPLNFKVVRYKVKKIIE